MLFNSAEFFIFALIFFPLYFLSSGRLRVLVCLVASYIFYGWWDWRFLALIIATSCITFFTGLFMEQSQPHRRKLLLSLSLISNLFILGYFKYFNFFQESLVAALGSIGYEPGWTTLNIILPVGISFYTFQALSYSVDRYYDRIEVETSLLNFSTYVALFPQLVAGPIVRASTLLPQLRSDQKPRVEDIAHGLEMFAWGFFLKVVLADSLGETVDLSFENPAAFNSMQHIIGVFFFAFQIYGDFAGYSLMAIGLGRIMGFDFGINFNRPYFSSSFSEFWQRWHISLSSWMRDYIYIPLGGNRGGRYKAHRNLMLTMLLGGLWHGASWNFVIWGGLHGLYLVIQRILGPVFTKVMTRLFVPRVLTYVLMVVVVFLLTNFAWIFFRADTWKDAWTIISIIKEFDLRILTGGGNVAMAKGLLIISLVILVDALSLCPSVRTRYFNSIAARMIGAASLLWMTALLGTFKGAHFIYFQF